MSNKKFFLLWLFLWLLNSPVFAKEKISLDIKSVYNYVKRHTPPIIATIRVAPNPPLANQKTQVLVNTFSKEKIYTGELNYSLDEGKSFTSLKLLPDETYPSIWKGELPPLANGQKVLFILNFKNELQDSAFEIFKSQENSPNYFSVITSADNLDVKDDLDILGVDAGYDENNLYFVLKVQGSFSSGVISELKSSYIHAYALGFLVRGIPFGFYWAPFAAQAHYPPMALASMSGIQEKGFTAKTEGGKLYLSFPQSFLQNPPLLRAVFVTGAVTSITPVDGDILDISSFANIYFRYHTLIIGEPFAEQEELPKNFVKLDLTSFFNNDGVAFETNIKDGSLDGKFNLDGDQLPQNSEVSYFDIPFNFPDTNNGKNNNLIPKSQKIEIPPDNYSQIYFLGFSVRGNYSAPLTLEYKDNTTEQISLALSDGCGAPIYNEVEAIHTEYRFNVQKEEMDLTECGIYLQTLKLNKEKTLTGFTLANHQNLRIFAITLGK